MKKAALNINFDSLRTIIYQKSYGDDQYLEKVDDPCFFAILDRFVKLAEKYGVPLSFYMIGKDLENTKVADRVLHLSQSGHEIGNHSYSHISNLGDLPYSKIEQEIYKAHLIITDVLNGRTPDGFIAPAWSTSRNLIKALIKFGYAYDTSLFPSFIMPLIQLRLKLASDKGYKKSISVFRKDLWGNLLGSRKPFLASPRNPWNIVPFSRGNNRDIMCLPLPTIWPRIPVWHSWAFKKGRRAYECMLRSAVKNNPAFYLLMHPADLFDPETDIRGFLELLLGFERMSVPLKDKMERMELVFDVICSECDVVTMKELAENQMAECRGLK